MLAANAQIKVSPYSAKTKIFIVFEEFFNFLLDFSP